MTLIAEGAAPRGAGRDRREGPPSREPLVLFEIDGERFGVDLWAVERVIHAMAAEPSPGPPPEIAGHVLLRGRRTPVVDTRHCFGLAERDPAFGDQLVLLGRGEREVALLADAVVGIIDPKAHPFVETGEDAGGGGFVRATIPMEGGAVSVCDLDRIFDLARSGETPAPL